MILLYSFGALMRTVFNMKVKIPSFLSDHKDSLNMLIMKSMTVK